MKYMPLQRVIVAVVLAWAGLAQGADPNDTDAKVKAAVAGLSAGDPAQREQAAKTILELGSEARRAVFEASRSDEPELRAKASELLLKLPWYLPDDSPAVRELLANYGKLDVPHRKEVVSALAELTQHGHDALLRLIVEEPSDDVKWGVAAGVRKIYRDETLQGYRNLDTDTDCAPLLAAAGHAWLTKDVAKGSKLLRKALEADQKTQSNDEGEIDSIFERLQNLALLDGNYGELVKLLRSRAKRVAAAEEGETPEAVLELFAAHAKFGPFEGFEKDVDAYAAHLADPRVQFAVGKVYERSGQGMLAQAAFRAAFAVDLVSVQDRFTQGDFLLQHGWLDLAEGEYKSVFDLSAEHPRERGQWTPELDDANAHFRLAQVAAAREEDLPAATHMKQAMDLHYKARGELRGSTEQGMWQDISWHYLRAAKAKGDAAGVSRRLTEITSNSAPLTNPDIANDVVPMLRAAGRAEEADAVFKKVYEGLQEQWSSIPDHPMPKNNIAWLCARCGERKEEALKLAEQATRAMPDNAAFLDTLAEAKFVAGQFDEAARLERRVVNARPGDRFLQNQLKRFEEAAAKKRSE